MKIRLLPKTKTTLGILASVLLPTPLWLWASVQPENSQSTRQLLKLGECHKNSTIGLNDCRLSSTFFPSQKSGVGAFAFAEHGATAANRYRKVAWGNNSLAKPKVYSSNADSPYIPTTTLTLSSPLKTNSSRIIEDIPYARHGDKNLLLDIYLPKQVTEPIPVILWIHGGAWRSGNKKLMPEPFLTSHGYAIVSINYRFTREAIFPAQIQDVKTAVRWIRAHAQEYGFDANRIGAAGASAGGDTWRHYWVQLPM